MRNVKRLIEIYEELHEASNGDAASKDLLSFAGIVLKVSRDGGLSHSERPLNHFNANFYSKPVDLVLQGNGFALASEEPSDRMLIGVECPKRRFEEFCIRHD